ncbi:DUF6088 family protein [Proteiniclasticum sp. QWL-01]|uniref:DUF6088 family protein n=1 Tax=Proteiniclasticum sp. QWL-01 TaxID=3036945 RepID=UPI0022072160|nr:DUF6088 family protein [Proteiniclasticum sp. QWL-01]UUM12896.1 DUF6088 family protein [Clostridiaceae bacterium HFYG-1003]WFF74448.1 DUF6088 family protein [Proteiniclasticum sp. QWL-01]
MSTKNILGSNIGKYKDLEVFNSRRVFDEVHKCGVTPAAFHKNLSRMAEAGVVYKVSKGLYCKPKQTRFGSLNSDENQIIEYFLGKKQTKGVLLGYRLYNQLGLTTQLAKSILIYSNKTDYTQSKVQHILIRKSNLTFSEPVKSLIQLLDVLEHLKEIQDIQTNQLQEYIKSTIVKYEDKYLEKILKDISFKKSTLAALKAILDNEKVNHNLDQYLSKNSKYNLKILEDLNVIPRK